jgi:hypothetical protein
MAKVSCPALLPEGLISTRLAQLLEPKPIDPTPAKGAVKRRSARGISICEPQKPGMSRASSGKEEIRGAADEEEEISEVAEEEEEESSSKRGDSEAYEERAASLPPRTRKRPGRSSVVMSSDISTTELTEGSSPKRARPDPST